MRLGDDGGLEAEHDRKLDSWEGLTRWSAIEP